MENKQLKWIISAKNLSQIIDFHDFSNHENGFLVDYNSLFWKPKKKVIIDYFDNIIDCFRPQKPNENQFFQQKIVYS